MPTDNVACGKASKGDSLQNENMHQDDNRQSDCQSQASSGECCNANGCQSQDAEIKRLYEDCKRKNDDVDSTEIRIMDK